MSIIQKQITLHALPKGFHIITKQIVEAIPEVANIEAGLLHVFIRHSSASLTINENYDPDVRHDLEQHFDTYVPEHASYYLHTSEGPDDMPAHIKASTLGSSVTIPIVAGKLALGTWQGIYLGEHRAIGGPRKLIATMYY